MTHKPSKPFLTYQEQLDNLTKKKLLIIKDTDYALSKLQDVCYYSLIDGYKNLFYNPMTRQYEPETTFDDIVSLYNFDKKLRLLLFQHICSIEQKLRSLISYHFCDAFSENQGDYLTSNNYNNSSKNQKSIQKLIRILSIEAKTNTEHAYVVYQRNTYGNVPLWVVLNTLTLGQTSKMYSLLTSSVQSKISTHFENVNERELIQYLKVLTHFRNICAHNERLFSFHSRFEIPDTSLHHKLHIAKNGNQYSYGKSDLFAVIIAFRYLLNKDDFSIFKKDFTKLLSSFEKQTSVKKKQKLLASMGFPKNWRNITRYKL